MKVLVGLLALFVGITPPVFAESMVFSVGFENVTANNVTDAAIGEEQLSVDVWDIGLVDNGMGGMEYQVKFIFRNAGPAASSITDIYFDDTVPETLDTLISLIDYDDGVDGDPDVDFSEGASPPDLPGGNNATPDFNVTAGFAADSDSPIASEGINPDESLGMIFRLRSGKTFADVINSFLGINPNSATEPAITPLRIGIHVQGFEGGGSESFVSTIPDIDPIPDPDISTVPEPASLSLLGIGIVALYGYSRRNRAKSRLEKPESA